MGVEMGMAETGEKRQIAWIDGFAILVAVMISSGVQAANDYEKEKQFRHLNQIAEDKKMVFISKILFFI